MLCVNHHYCKSMWRKLSKRYVVARWTIWKVTVDYFVLLLWQGDSVCLVWKSAPASLITDMVKADEYDFSTRCVRTALVIGNGILCVSFLCHMGRGICLKLSCYLPTLEHCWRSSAFSNFLLHNFKTSKIYMRLLFCGGSRKCLLFCMLSWTPWIWTCWTE